MTMINRNTPVSAYIGIGGNLGNVVDTFCQVRRLLSVHPAVYGLTNASLYRSAPVGYIDQPDFFNSVIMLSTTLDPHTLLTLLQTFEQQFDRQRPFKHAPRTLDLDILTYGDMRIQSDTLTIPHPEIQHRLFVLKPLLELAPNWAFPNNQPASDFIEHCLSQSVEKIANPDWILFSDSL